MTVSLFRNQTFAKLMFAYGCVSTVLASYVYVSFGVLLRPAVPDFLQRVGTLELWIGVAGAHMATFVVTFGGDNEGEWDPLWAPLFSPSKLAVLIGRTILIAAACNVLFWFPYVYLTVDRWATWRAVSAMLLVSTIYTAVHWALRPENIFSWPILQFLRDPLASLTRPALRPVVEAVVARRPAMPFDEWLTELVRCCELAASSSRLVNSEKPGDGEIDCLDFKDLVLGELASVTCVLRYKKRLSRDGFQSIRSFLQSVVSLDARRPDQAAWQEAVHKAQLVLGLRATLVRPAPRGSRRQ